MKLCSLNISDFLYRSTIYIILLTILINLVVNKQKKKIKNFIIPVNNGTLQSL